MSLDADDLLLFSRVMEAGSFSRAAERMHLPKSTLSRRLSALEERLGEKLLQRSTRRLALTEFGEGVLEHARAVAAEPQSQQPSPPLTVCACEAATPWVSPLPLAT